MKLFYKSLGAMFLTAVFLLSSCTGFVDGFDEDPNNATDAPTQTIANQVLVSNILAYSGEMARMAAMMTNQYAGLNRQMGSYYVHTLTQSNYRWHYYYIACIQNANLVIERSTESGDRFLKGIMLLHKAQAFGTLTSMWGDVPFTEANQFPMVEDAVFDSQASIYAGVQSILDEAIADFESGVAAGGGRAGLDFYYAGDAAKWLELAHSLKARYYLHTKDYANALAQAEQGLSSLSNSFNIPTSTGTYQADMNIYHSFLVRDRATDMGAAGAYLPSLLDPSHANYRGDTKTDETARFAYIFTPASTPGGNNWNINTSASGIYTPTSGFTLFGYQESQLILAEAAFRQGNSAAALTALNNTRAANEAQYGGRYDAYSSADFAGDELLMEILEEKYISLVGQMEPFNDMRRTGNALNIPAASPNGQYAERFLIPQTETDANSNAPSPAPGLYEKTAVNQ